MKYLTLFSLILFSTSAFPQLDNLNQILSNTDSIHFSVWMIHTKEMSTPDQENQEYEKELARTTLSQKDQQILLSNLQNPKSYNQNRALLSHHNMLFSIYHKDSISFDIRISAMNGNIDIEDKSSGKYFRSSCSDSFGEILMEIISENGFSHFFDEIDLQGINTRNND